MEKMYLLGGACIDEFIVRNRFVHIILEKGKKMESLYVFGVKLIELKQCLSRLAKQDVLGLLAMCGFESAVSFREYYVDTNDVCVYMWFFKNVLPSYRACLKCIEIALGDMSVIQLEDVWDERREPHVVLELMTIVASARAAADGLSDVDRMRLIRMCGYIDPGKFLAAVDDYSSVGHFAEVCMPYMGFDVVHDACVDFARKWVIDNPDCGYKPPVYR